MKILFDFKLFSEQRFGGPSKYFIELIKALNKKNITTEIFSPFYINEHLKSEKDLKKTGIYVKNKKYFGRLFNFTNKIITNVNSLITKADVIHNTYYQDPHLKRKQPNVLTVYDLIHEKFNKDFNYHLPKQKALENSDHIICISENTKRDLQYYYNINSEKITVIHLATTKKIFTKPNSIKNNLLYIGSRKRYKNFKILVKIFSKKEIQNNFNLICFGGGNFLNEELKFFQSLKIPLEKIKFMEGDDKLLGEQYKSSFALIYPSLYEGFGLPVLEAMSYGCPVISSNTSSLPEVYGSAALSFNPNHDYELLNRLNELIHDNKLRNKMILEGYRRIEKFSWDKCADKTIDVYKKVTNE